MKIAFFVNHASFFYSHIFPIANRANLTNHVELFCGNGASKEMESYAIKKVSKKIKINNLAFSSGNINFFKDICCLFYSIYKISLYKPDLIYCATPKGILFGGIISKILNIKSLVIFNTGMGFLFSNGANISGKIAKKIYLFFLKNYILKHKNKKIILENFHDASYFKKILKVKTKEIKIIKGAGINLKKFKNIYSLKNKLIILPARVIREKGIKEFYEASKILKKKYPEWLFIVAGALDYKKMSNFSKEDILIFKKSKFIRFIGYKKNILYLLKKTSIVCLPSYREGFSKSLIEAAALGIPTVTSNTIGCKDAIIPKKTGELCKVKSVKSLVLKLKYLIDNPEIRKKYSNNSKIFAKKNFNIRSVIQKNLYIYRQLNEKK